MSISTLKDISTKIGSGATPRGGKNSYKTEGISLIRSLNVYDLKFEYGDLAFIDDLQAQRLSNVEVRKNDILLNITGASVARCCMVPKSVLPARVNQHVSIIRVKPELSNSKYILYCLVSYKYKQALLSLAQGGATREAITKEMIEKFEIALPSLMAQHKIASILSTYDDLIENNLKRIKILEEMAQMIYREWFVNFRFPGHEKVKMVDSPLGKIPEGWEVENLFKISEVTYGFPFKSKLFTEDKNGNMPVIRIRDILNDKTKTYTPEKALEKYIVRNGDILIGMDGDFHMGRWAGDETYLNQRVVRFRPNEGISPYFLFWALEKPIHFFNSTITGTTVAHLGDKHLRTINIVIPPVSLLEHVGNILDPIFNLEIELKVKNANLRKTRDLLLPRLISGELDVEGLDIKIEESP